jgi:hypothetical protein
MQREIELLMLALQQRHQREVALLERIMSSISKGNEAHNEMVGGISAALAEHEASSEQDRNLRHELEGEIENVIHYIRKDTAREG